MAKINKKSSKKRKRIIALMLFMFLGIWVYWGNVSIKTTKIEINDSQLPDSFEGFVIAQISDLHNANFGKEQTRLLFSIKEASPDIIVVTGDLIDYKKTNIDKAMDFIVGAIEIAPVYYVTGNHEALTDKYLDLQTRLIEAGVIILRDQHIELERNSQRIQLIGLDDPEFTMHNPEDYVVASVMNERLNSLVGEEAQYKILLSHRPELFDIYTNKVNLVLSGHAHGGQFRIPFIGGVIAPNQGFFPDYTSGLYEKDNTKMIVSRGLGNSIIPFRINNSPEIVVVTLKK